MNNIIDCTYINSMSFKTPVIKVGQQLSQMNFKIYVNKIQPIFKWDFINLSEHSYVFVSDYKFIPKLTGRGYIKGSVFENKSSYKPFMIKILYQSTLVKAIEFRDTPEFYIDNLNENLTYTVMCYDLNNKYDGKFMGNIKPEVLDDILTDINFISRVGNNYFIKIKYSGKPQVVSDDLDGKIEKQSDEIYKIVANNTTPFNVRLDDYSNKLISKTIKIEV